MFFLHPEESFRLLRNMGKKKEEIVSLDGAFAYHINQTHRLLRVHFLQMTRNAGLELTPEQYFILNKLSHNPGCSQADLSGPMEDRPNVTRGLDVLEKRGLLRRMPDPQDRRKFKIFLTSDGESAVRSLNPVILRERSRIYAGLVEQDQQALRRILGQIESNLRRMEDES